ncbi:MAG: hypothetical protein M1834_000576 [Cirrosporium novae-zelandiae]|nr:MAG: hypothetical protein M1834_000576 [Cirrosporium novae-zelandiae]
MANPPPSPPPPPQQQPPSPSTSAAPVIPPLTRYLLDLHISPSPLPPLTTLTPHLPAPLQSQIQKFLFPKDRHMSLGSQVLKYAAVSKITGLGWRDIEFGVGEWGRPRFMGGKGDMGKGVNVEFNVSHQAGVVGLVACEQREREGEDKVRLGIDIVCTDERARQDLEMIRKEGGVTGWVGVYREVFSEGELRELAGPVDWIDGEVDGEIDGGVNGGNEGDALLSAKIRRFYAFWCLKEAYIKMTGEALLAPWLRELEFRHVRPPHPPSPPTTNPFGETVDDFEIWFKGDRIKNVAMELRAYRGNYMIATAVSLGNKGDGGEGGVVRWRDLDLDSKGGFEMFEPGKVRP